MRSFLNVFRMSTLLVLLSAGCGTSEEIAQTKSLTDMKSVLLFQHVEGDKFQLLVCPYQVDMEIDQDCRNVLLNPDGTPFYFAGIPKRPWAFALSQKTVEKFLVVPLAVGGAVITFLALKKLRTQKLPNKLYKEMEHAIEVLKGRLAVDADSLAKVNYHKQIEKVAQQYVGVGKPRYVHLREAPNARKAMSSVEYRDLFHAELNFVTTQFAKLRTVAADFNIPPQTKRRTNILAGGRLRGLPAPTPDGVLKRYSASFSTLKNKELNKLQKFIDDNPYAIYDRDSAFEALRSAQEFHDKMIDGFFHEFTQLIDNPQVLTEIKKTRVQFRTQTVNKLGRHFAQPPDSISHYVISGITGALAGSYLPRHVPALDDYLLTEREWKGLFTKGDTFKNPQELPDSYAVVQKLAQFLKRKGTEVTIAEQVFFGLKNAS